MCLKNLSAQATAHWDDRNRLLVPQKKKKSFVGKGTLANGRTHSPRPSYTSPFAPFPHTIGRLLSPLFGDGVDGRTIVPSPLWPFSGRGAVAAGWDDKFTTASRRCGGEAGSGAAGEGRAVW